MLQTGANLHRKVSRIEACPLPFCKLGIRFDHTKAMFWSFLLGFGWKNRTKFEWRPFFLPFTWLWGKNRTEFDWRPFFLFCSSPDFGGKIGPNLIEDLFFLLFTWFWAKNRTRRDNLIPTVALLTFSELSAPPPPFQNPVYATGYRQEI